MERTLVILKPDVVRRKLIGEIISRFERKNLTIIQMKVMNIDKELALLHYQHVKKYSFFEDMISYITSGPVVVMIISGSNAISTVRNMVGKTSCHESPIGTIRGDYGFHPFENLIHSSDSEESAGIEIQRFFST
jgi:nucleoside-diphosphate kinase